MLMLQQTTQMLGYPGAEEHKDQRAISHDVMARGRPLSCSCPCYQMTPRSCDQVLTSPTQAAARPEHCPPIIRRSLWSVQQLPRTRSRVPAWTAKTGAGGTGKGEDTEAILEILLHTY